MDLYNFNPGTASGAHAKLQQKILSEPATPTGQIYYQDILYQWKQWNLAKLEQSTLQQ